MRATEVESTAHLEPLNTGVGAPNFTQIYLQEMLTSLGQLPWRRYDTVFSTVGAHEQIINKRTWMSGKDVTRHFIDHFSIGDWSADDEYADPEGADLPEVPLTPELGPHESHL